MKHLLILFVFVFVSRISLAQNVGVNTTMPQGELHITKPSSTPAIVFVGSGLNDLSASSTSYPATVATNIVITLVDASVTPNTFNWYQDGGPYSPDISIIAGSPILLTNGIYVTWASDNGHTSGDKWDISISPNYYNGLVVKDAQVGIGTVAPSKKLDVKGDINFDGDLYQWGSLYTPTYTGSIDNLSDAKKDISSNLVIGYNGDSLQPTAYYNTAIGYSLVNTTIGNYNTTIGAYNLNQNKTGSNNVVVGAENMPTNISGSSNIALGNYNLYYNTAGNANIAIGESSMFNNAGDSSIGIGYYTLNQNNTGYKNIAIGNRTMESSNSAIFDIAVGNNALKNDNAGFNLAIGENALKANTTGQRNLAIGHNALSTNLIAEDNVAIGYTNLQYNTGNNNTAIGSEAMYFNESGYQNTAIGYRSMYNNNDGPFNTGLGYYSLGNNISGGSNTALGYYALGFNDYGNENTAIGREALYFNQNGSHNTALGLNALKNTTNSFNTAVGLNAGITNSTGIGNTLLGTYADVGSNNLVNATAIGSRAQVNTSNAIVLGSVAGVNGATNNAKVGIGTTSPHSSLQVDGTFAVGVSLNLSGTNNPGTPLSPYKGFITLVPNSISSIDNYQLPAPSSCAGRVYYLKITNGDVATLRTAAGGLLYGTLTIPVASACFPCLGVLATPSIMCISDGSNWHLFSL